MVDTVEIKTQEPTSEKQAEEKKSTKSIEA